MEKEISIFDLREKMNETIRKAIVLQKTEYIEKICSTMQAHSEQRIINYCKALLANSGKKYETTPLVVKVNVQKDISKIKTTNFVNVPVLWKQICMDFYTNEGKDLAQACFDDEQTWNVAKAFIDCSAEMSKSMIYPPSKIDFCFFANIQTSDYDNVLRSTDEYSETVQKSFNKIEDFIVSTLTQMAAARQIDGSIVKNLLSTYGERGHSQIESGKMRGQIASIERKKKQANEVDELGEALRLANAAKEYVGGIK